MGLEQSSHSSGGSLKVGKGRHTKASSPRPSISSDSDVPYVSSTVNNPIGGHSIVVVKEGSVDAQTAENDEDLIKLQSIPQFWPILKGSLHMVSTEQNALAARIREIDYAVSQLSTMMTERQKKFGKYVEQLLKVHELSNLLQTTESALAKTIEQLDQLNRLLPPDEQLEPFVMVTG
ncbi:hypothetical protein MTO96_013365 [Rhipicephalus appendiculatus]